MVFKHSDPLKSKTEGKARIFLGIDATARKYLGVDHTCTEDLYPTLALAKTAALAAAGKAGNVNLGRRLGEGEVVGTEADFRFLTKEVLCEKLKRTLKITHGDAAVNYKTLKLMEKGRVRCVNVVGTVNASGRDDTDRGLLLFHNAHLNGTSRIRKH